jgi:hypothetical protein
MPRCAADSIEREVSSTSTFDTKENAAACLLYMHRPSDPERHFGVSLLIAA